MKKLVYTFWIIVLGLFLNSCGTYYIASDYSDPIYDENYIPKDTVDSEEELERKWRFDSEFREDYYTYLTYQDYSFFSDMYWRNRMWRWGWTSSWDYYTNWQWNWYGGYNYWSPWNQYPWYGNWSSSYWYWYQWNNPWQNYSYVYGPRTSWLGNVYNQRPSNRWRHSISNRSSISNRIQNNREKPRVIINSNKPVINNIKPNNNWNTNNRPNNNIIVKPNNNSRPVYNNNNSRPVYNNNSRPSNNWSKPSNTSRPSNNSRSISTPRKRGGQ